MKRLVGILPRSNQQDVREPIGEMLPKYNLTTIFNHQLANLTKGKCVDQRLALVLEGFLGSLQWTIFPYSLEPDGV